MLQEKGFPFAKLSTGIVDEPLVCVYDHEVLVAFLKLPGRTIWLKVILFFLSGKLPIIYALLSGSARVSGSAPSSLPRQTLSNDAGHEPHRH
jgi:hypothetical protein